MNQLALIGLTFVTAVVLVHYFNGGQTGAGAYLRWLFTGTTQATPTNTSTALETTAPTLYSIAPVSPVVANAVPAVSVPVPHRPAPGMSVGFV